MPGGVADAPHVIQTEAGYVTWGIPVSHSAINSPDGASVPDRYLPRVLTLLEEYGAICTAAQAVFPIGSLYRSLEYQYRHFYTKRAMHTEARALDLLPSDEWPVRRMSVYALERRREFVSRLGGIGIAPGWLHLEITPVSRRAVWQWGTNRKAD